MDPWAFVGAHPFLVLAGMGLVATTALWVGLVVWQARQDRRTVDSLSWQSAEVERLRREAAALKGIADELDRD